MSWFCSGYSPRRFILAIVRGLSVRKNESFAKVWKPRGRRSWYWITFLETTGKAKTISEAMRAAEKSIEGRIGL